ncbi:MAG TPA: hypothetical protein VGG60_17730 [Candidatus Binataceae bacterium]
MDGGWATSLTGDTNAEAYVRGLIAVPVADAHTNFASNATLNIEDKASGGPQTTISSGENVTLDAYHGSPVLQSDGTGHGYELGFIPVTDGTDDTSAPVKSVVTIGAVVVAGEYHDQEVTINANGTVSVASGAPVAYSYDGNYAISSFLTDNFGSTSAFGSLVSTSNVPTVALGALYASGGLIRINADTIQGAGSLTAYGAPTINVLDAQPIYLILAGGALIPDTPGGSIVWTGGAGLAAAQAAGVKVAPNNPDGTPTIAITLTYGSSVGNSSAGPALFYTGALTNLGGLIHLINDFGSIGPKANSTSDQSIVYAPNGAYVFQADGADGNYIAGGSAYDEWASDIVYPGGAPSTSLTALNGNAAMNYVATAIYERGTYNGILVTDHGNGEYTTWGTQVLNTDGSASTTSINAALYGQAGNIQPNDKALVIFGACIQEAGSASCLGSGGYNIADVDGHYGNSQQPNYSVVTLNYANTVGTESTSGSAASKQIYGSLVAITAAAIDVNGSITVGKSTSYSADVSAGLGAVLADVQGAYAELYGSPSAFNADYNAIFTDAKAAGYTQAQANSFAAGVFGSSIDVAPFLSLSSQSASLGVTATYNAAGNQISFGNISTFSTGASVKLDGAIVSTNSLGNIHLNSGYGNVSITNESTIGLNFSDINTGSIAGGDASTSTLTITNRLLDQIYGNSKGDTATYIYNPVSGLKLYQSDNGASPVDSTGKLIGDAVLLTLPSGSTSSSSFYQTVIGAEFEFVQEALLSRTVTVTGQTGCTGSTCTPLIASDWTFSTNGTGNANNPWYYVSAAYISSLTQNAPASASAQSSTLVGEVVISSNVINNVNQDPAFQETITGNTIGGGVIQSVGYVYDLGFATQPAGDVSYTFNYPTQAFLRLTTTVKADNKFTISFGGNATGSVSIVSPFTPVVIGGAINNPTGSTSITNASSITQTAGGSIVSNSLNLWAFQGIGSAATPIVAELTAGLGTTPVGGLTATTYGGGVYINLNSGANGFQVASSISGDVVVHAAGALAPGSAGFSVTADYITLTSSGGSIGTAATPLALNGRSVLNLSTFQYSIDNVTANVSANGDIGLTVPNGNFLVGEIASQTGGVTINVPNGGIYDALSQTAGSALSSTQISAIATALNLGAGSATGAAADAAAGAAAITSFNATVTSDLSTYQTFIANGSIGNGSYSSIGADAASTDTLYSPLATSAAVQAARANPTGTSQFTTLTDAQIQTSASTLTTTNGLFTLNAASIATYAPQAASALGISVSRVTTAQVQAWANAQYQVYATTFTQAYGSSWKSTVTGASAPTSFSVATSANATTLTALLTTDANWTANQLVDAIYVPRIATVGSNATTNISGRDVTLNIGSAVGTYTPSGLQINLSALTAGTLTTEQQAALAVATAPGAVTLIGTDANGDPLPADTTLLTLAPGSTVTAINIAQTAPLFVDAAGAFKVTSGSSVYLQGTLGSSISLNALIAQGDVNVQAPGSITAAAVSGVALSSTQIGTTGNLVLAAGSGSIGSSTLPVTFQIGGNLVYASAGTDSYLNVVGGNARVEQDLAGGTASLTTATGYSILSSLAGINVQAANIILNSKGAVGTSTTSLDVLATGTLSGSAAGLANIDAPTLNGNASNALTISNFTASGDLTVLTGGALTVTGTIDSTAGAVSTTSASLVMQSGSAIQAAETIAIDTVGNATLGALTSTEVLASPGDAISVLAGGSILANADGINASAGSNGMLSLTATTGIGTAAVPLHIVAAPVLAADVTSATGSIYIEDDSALTVASIVAPSVISIQAASLTLNSSVMSGTISLTGTSGLSFSGLTLTSTSGDIDLTGSAVTGATVNGYGAVSLVSTGTSDLSINLTSVSAGTTIAATAQAGGIDIGSASSGGTQTIAGETGVTFTTLTANAGDIGVTSSAGSINGTTVLAKGSADLSAYADNDGTSLTTQTGSATLSSTTGDVNWQTVNAATTFDATAAVGSITLGSVTSDGTQTIEANGALTYTTLKTNGMSGDVGTIKLTSDTASITGQASSDTLDAHGSFILNAATTISGTMLTAQTGSGFAKAGGAIGLGTTTTATTLDVTSTGSTVTLGSATSGGTQTVTAKGAVAFTDLTTNGIAGDAGNLFVTSQTASIAGGSFTANGSATLTSMTSNEGATATATNGSVTLAAGSLTSPSALASINWTNVSAGTLVDATSGGALTLGSVTSGTTGSDGAQTIEGHGAVGLTTLIATGGTIGVTSDASTVMIGSASSDGTQTIAGETGVTFTTLTANAGDIGVTSSAGSINGTTLTATSGAASLTANDGAITVGAVTSAGLQTLTALNAIEFTTLKTTGTGAIDVTSSAGAVAGQGGSSLIQSVADTTISGHSVSLDTVTAVDASITSATTLSGTLLTTTKDASLVAGADASGTTPASAGSLSWTTVNAGTTFEATAYDGAITNLTSVTSGGTQTIAGETGVTFTTLTANAGDIGVTSSAGSINGTTVLAKGSADLSAYADNDGTSLTTQTGSATLSSTTGDVNWQTVNAATTFDATAAVGSITLGSATSDGTQTIEADSDIHFTMLTSQGTADPGNITVTSVHGGVFGGSIKTPGFATINGDGIAVDDVNATAGITMKSSGNISANGLESMGPLDLDAGGTVILGSVSGASFTLSTPSSLTINDLTMLSGVIFNAGDVTVGRLRQGPNATGPLQLSITGYQGGIGNSAQFGLIDTPNGLDIVTLSEYTVSFATTAEHLLIEDALLTGTMQITTPQQHLWFNDVSSQPILGNDVQFFSQDGHFYLIQDGTTTLTNSYIVQYDANAAILEVVDGVIYRGPSFVRDFDRQGRTGNSNLVPQFAGGDAPPPWYSPVEEFGRLIAIMDLISVESPVSGSAVNLGEVVHWALSHSHFRSPRTGTHQ